MRLIDADALMQEYARFVAPSKNSDSADVPTWNDAVSLLGSAPTIEERKWIPCSERLPERNMDCLFTVFEPSCECDGTLFPEETRTVFGTVRHYPNGRFGKRSWTWWEEDGMERTVFDEYSKEDWGLETFITAWRPLPEPYRKPEEG